MLEIAVIVLVVLWGFGYWGPYHVHLGSFIHILLAVAALALVVRLLQGRRLL